MEKLKTVKIRKNTHRSLLELGKKGESFSDIIDKLIKKNKKK